MKTLINKYKLLSIGAKASLIYIIANLFTKGLSIITTPIFTRIMTIEQIGIMNTFASWSSILYVVVTLSLSSGGFSIAMVDFENQRDQYQSSILSLSTLSTIIFGIIYLLLSKQINSFTQLSTTLMIIMFMDFLFHPAIDFWLQRNRFEYNYKNVAILTILMTFLSSIVAVCAVLVGNTYGYTDTSLLRLSGQFSIIILIAAIIYFKTIKKGMTLYNKQFWLFALTVNLPLIVHSLAKHILDISDRTMISNMIGLSAVGIYGTLYNISSLSIIIWNAINASLIPYTFERLKEKKYKSINKIVIPLLSVYAIICIALTMISPEIVAILTTKEYFQAIYLMPPIAAGIFMTSVYNIYSNVLLYHKKTLSIMISTVIVAIINVVLNYIFLKKYGYIAASYTTLIAYVLLALLQFLMIKFKKIKTGYNDKMVFLISILVVIICLLCNLLYNTYLVRYIVIIITTVILYVYRKKIIEKINVIIKK